MVILCTYAISQLPDMLNLFLCQLKLLFIELVMASYTPGICIHDLLHCILKLFCAVHAFAASEDCIIFSYLIRKSAVGSLPGIFSAYTTVCTIACGHVQLLNHSLRSYLAFNHRACYIFLRTSSGYIACGKQIMYCRASVCIYPVTACRMASDYIWLCSFYLNILLTWILT